MNKKSKKQAKAYLEKALPDGRDVLWKVSAKKVTLSSPGTPILHEALQQLEVSVTDIPLAECRHQPLEVSVGVPLVPQSIQHHQHSSIHLPHPRISHQLPDPLRAQQISFILVILKQCYVDMKLGWSEEGNRFTCVINLR